ncbi:hypothetical protein BLA29_003549, partial [Euroglyphus maynei]
MKDSPTSTPTTTAAASNIMATLMAPYHHGYIPGYIGHQMSNHDQSIINHPIKNRETKENKKTTTASSLFLIDQILKTNDDQMSDCQSATSETGSETNDIDTEEEKAIDDLSMRSSRRKVRRSRTTFTTYQLHQLERAFEKV